MKKIIAFAIIIFTSFTLYAQSIQLNDLGVLLSQDKNYGSARFEAMSGAFGALGGIPSSLGVNPAGSAVAIRNPVSITLGVTSADVKASYYGKDMASQNEGFNLPQAGAIFAFETNNDSKWNKIALSFNYQLKNAFNGGFSTNGNSGVAYFNEHPDDNSTPKNIYNLGQEQRFDNLITGQSSKFGLGIAGVYNKKMHIGASVNFHAFSFAQTAQLNEINKDALGNTLTVFNEQKNRYESSGVSLGLGFIYKINHAFRVGMAYESPTFYQEVLEDTNVSKDNFGYTRIEANNVTDVQFNSIDKTEGYSFGLRTPSKVTASSAFVFSKKGLLSVDYTYKNYAGINFGNGNFTDINNAYSEFFRATHAVNIGTEWRFDEFSIRGGYHFAQNELKAAKSTDNLKGLSVGLGYNFGNMKVDVAYRKDNNTGFYNIYPTDANVDSVELDYNQSRILATLSFSL